MVKPYKLKELRKCALKFLNCIYNKSSLFIVSEKFLSECLPFCIIVIIIYFWFLLKGYTLVTFVCKTLRCYEKKRDVMSL